MSLFKIITEVCAVGVCLGLITKVCVMELGDLSV